MNNWPDSLINSLINSKIFLEYKAEASVLSMLGKLLKPIMVTFSN